MAGARGGNAMLDAAADALFAELASDGVAEARARWVAERLALLQGALFVRHAPQAVADAFCGSRLGGYGGRTFGTLPPEFGADEVLARGC